MASSETDVAIGVLDSDGRHWCRLAGRRRTAAAPAAVAAARLGLCPHPGEPAGGVTTAGLPCGVGGRSGIRSAVLPADWDVAAAGTSQPNSDCGSLSRRPVPGAVSLPVAGVGPDPGTGHPAWALGLRLSPAHHLRQAGRRLSESSASPPWSVLTLARDSERPAARARHHHTSHDSQ